MNILIGSQALNYHQNIRNPKDMDILGSYQDIIDYINQCKINNNYGKLNSIFPHANGKKIIAKFENKIIEAEIVFKNTNTYDLYEKIKNDNNTIIKDGFMIPSLNVLYMFKMSHRYLKNSPHFKKTMDDILLLRKMGAYIEDTYLDLYKKREKDTYNYGHPKLNQDKNNFFNDNVNYVYDHDTIHLSVKQFEQPAYMYFKPKEEEVWCSKDLWDKCEEKLKLAAVFEETQVLALERSQVLFDNIEPKRSFEIALSKVCTSITSGWFREYAWENYYNVLEMYNPNYVNKFWADVENGLVKKLENKNSIKDEYQENNQEKKIKSYKMK